MARPSNERLKPGSMHLRHDTRFETYCGLPLQVDGSMSFTSTMTPATQRMATCKACRIAFKRDMDPNLRAQDILEKFKDHPAMSKRNND